MYTICGKEYNINTSELYLTNKSISIIPNEIFKLSQLVILDLSNNNIKDIPKDICNLKKLEIYKI